MNHSRSNLTNILITTVVGLFGACATSGLAQMPRSLVTDNIPSGVPKGYVEFQMFPYEYPRTARTTGVTALRPGQSNIQVDWVPEIAEIESGGTLALGRLYRDTHPVHTHSFRGVFVWRRVAATPGKHTYSGTIAIPRHLPPTISTGPVTVEVNEGMVTLVRLELRILEEIHGAPPLIPLFKKQGETTGIRLATNVTITSQLPLGSDAKAISLMREALKHSDWTVRWSAVRRLGDIEGNDAEGSLLDALKDETPEVRVRAAMYLAKSKDPKIIDSVLSVLIGALEDKGFPERTQAVGLLGSIGDKRAIEPLKKCAEKSALLFSRPSFEEFEKLCTWSVDVNLALENIEKANR